MGSSFVDTPRNLNYSATADRLQEFIRATVEAAGFSRLGVALSGGVDSSAAAALAARALGPGRIYPILLPYRDWHASDSQRARELTGALSIPAEQVAAIDIAPMVDSFLGALRLPPAGSLADESTPEAALRIGNIMARVRMIVLFDHARRHQALVLGTENRSEHYLGYYTRFGDEASDLEPLRGLFKTEVVRLARHLGLPSSIVDAAPSAGLWKGQTDEGEFGFTYAQADAVLYAMFDRQWNEDELVNLGIPHDVVLKVIAWVRRVEFKRDLPYLGPDPVLAGDGPAP
ncbi:MAG: NAD+ synthase [Anaerolineales bacterium]